MSDDLQLRLDSECEDECSCSRAAAIALEWAADYLDNDSDNLRDWDPKSRTEADVMAHGLREQAKKLREGGK